MNDAIKTILLWMVIGIILISVFNNFGPRRETDERISYSSLVSEVKQGNVKSVTITDQNIEGTLANNKTFISYLPMKQDPALLEEMIEKNVVVKGKPPEQPGLWVHLLNLLPWIVLFAIWIYVLRQQAGGGKGGAFSFGRSRARLLNSDQVKVTFADVAGCDEAKEEVKELVDFLKDPGKFQRLGGKIPRGVLLVGPPGTGKTLLARAVAGEAKVPFFTISGSDFVEMFVGVGASRVRDMFEQAKKQAPCIIFIDEIDAVGRHRGAGLGGGHDEREQTLNQLLVEMDGFQGNEGVIVVAATNRPDVLDPALLRPGRFDRQVVVGLPDVKGREYILRVHSRKVPLGDNVDVAVIARSTPGFSGADLANIVNEAALFAARSNKRVVEMEDFEKAKDKVIMGAERRSIVMSEDEKKLTAYHEAGHAIVGLLVPMHDPVHKVTIIPRGRALGVTMFLPEGDRYNYSREYLESKLSSLFGGRIAEEIIFGTGKVTTGASNDIQKATEIARNMVTKWGLSDKVGPLTIGSNDEIQGYWLLRNIMTAQFKTIGIYGRVRNDGVTETLKKLITFLQKLGKDVVLDTETAASIPDVKLKAVSGPELCKHCQLLIVVGGDGSLLHAAHAVIDNEIPVLGVNRGRLGFLTDIIPTELEKIKAILDGEYILEKRFLLEASVELHGKVLGQNNALNEVALIPDSVPHMSEFEIYIDDQFVCSQDSDGLIVATPTGSTAYALSGGGPILHPKLDAFVLVPMFPHSLNMRPIVIEGNRRVTLVITPNNVTTPRITCDSQPFIHTPPGSHIIISKKQQHLHLIHPLDYDYYQSLRSKLYWGQKLQYTE